ncbi:hypothetical protein DFQ30_005751 [Apophysomyces sp. BC1015]|nr:hypothetical protein DFQ30_005751 [Apophysomyces sp. BC1015]
MGKGFADKVRVQATWAFKIPDNIESIAGAPLLCAGVTTYLPFKHYKIGKDSSVGVVGIGGLGHLAIQWANAKECKRVIAFSSSASKAAEATKLGASDFVVIKQGVPEEYFQSVDYLLVCGSGKSTNWDQLLELLKTHGKCVLLDVPEQPLSISAVPFVYRHISMVGSFVGSNDDVEEMLAFASEKGVRPWVQTVANTLEEVNYGVQDLIDGKAHYRLVICGRGRT